MRSVFDYRASGSVKLNACCYYAQRSFQKLYSGMHKRGHLYLSLIRASSRDFDFVAGLLVPALQNNVHVCNGSTFHANAKGTMCYIERCSSHDKTQSGIGQGQNDRNAPNQTSRPRPYEYYHACKRGISQSPSEPLSSPVHRNSMQNISSP